MPSFKPLIDVRGEVREISAADLKGFRPAAQVLPVSLRSELGVRRSQQVRPQRRCKIG